MIDRSMKSCITKDTKISLLYRMMKIRLVEERIVSLYPEGEMRCPVHLSIGQEATASGVSEALRKNDLVFGSHRCHGQYIAKGGNLKKMFAEIYGKSTGSCEGLGGSMHLFDIENGLPACAPIVGTTLPIAVGVAWAQKLKKSDVMTVAFLGDATVEEGVFHESLNFSLAKGIPIVFFCENNLYSVYTHLSERQPSRPISDLASGHGAKCFHIDGNNVEVVYETAKEAVQISKETSIPVFIEAKTYRWREHCGVEFDNHIGYRTMDEFNEWKARCPIDNYEKKLLSEGLITDSKINELQKEIEIEIDDAVQFAKSSPFPAPEVALKYVYA